MSLTNSKVLKTEPLKSDDAKWSRLILSTYQDAKGTTRTWEHAERRTRPKDSLVDGVGIVAIIEKPEGPEIMLQKQFRPPVNKVTIEVPAGLIDAGETPEEAAIRELKEETGFVGELSEVTPVMFNDPGFCNTNLRMVHVTIDMNREENKNPVTNLEENEFIEVFWIKLRSLYEELKRLEDKGFAIDARVATIAEGIEIAKKWNL